MKGVRLSSSVSGLMDFYIVKERLKQSLWLVGACCILGVSATWNAREQIGLADEGRAKFLLGATVTGALVVAWIVLFIAMLVSRRAMNPDYKPRIRTTNIPWWTIRFVVLSVFVALMTVAVVKYGDHGRDAFALLEAGRLDRLKERISGNPELLERHDRKSGKTLLELALENENAKAVDLLLANGAALGAVADRVNLAAVLDNLPMLEVLLVHGVDPNRPNEGGYAPLHLAVSGGNTNALALLLDAGANASVRDPLYQTPLMLAVLADDRPALQCLLEHGADPNLADRSGDTSLHKAVRRRNLAASRMLLENGAVAKAVDFAGRRPLDIAAANGDNELVSLFLDDPEMIGWASKDDLTAFDQAVREQKFDTARLLLAHGADMNRVMANGYTITHTMVIDKEYKTAEFLIGAGADVDIAAPDGETALDLMRRKQITMLLDLVEARDHPPKAFTNAVDSVESL